MSGNNLILWETKRKLKIKATKNLKKKKQCSIETTTQDYKITSSKTIKTSKGKNTLQKKVQ